MHGRCSSYHMLNAVEHFPQELAAAGLEDIVTGDLSYWLVCWQAFQAMVKRWLDLVDLMERSEAKSYAS